MPLLTKIDVANLANRVRNHRRLMPRHSEQDDLHLAADALLTLSDLVAVAWPVAVERRDP